VNKYAYRASKTRTFKIVTSIINLSRRGVILKLFSPLILGHVRLPNRLVYNAQPSGCTTPDGFVGLDLATYYLARAQSGAGLLVLEPAYILPPRDSATPHLGLYADAQVPDLRRCVNALHDAGAAVLIMLDQPLWIPQLTEHELHEIGEAFIMAAWRVRACSADGIMLSTVDGGPFEQLISPLRNQRDDGYGGSVIGRSQLLREVIEGIERWIGSHFTVGVRLNAEEFTPGGLNMQDARLLATRLANAGVRLLEIQARAASDMPIAHFPGWCVPMAAGIKAVVDIPVMVGGLLDDAELADSVIRDGGADLIAVGARMRVDPDWPLQARARLAQREMFLD
jgi:2,4-dienoyl-CoA reductase-like NADH-dependent reductase (Old Yellow Enzyme family)